jgi:hypothetical protein
MLNITAIKPNDILEIEGKRSDLRKAMRIIDFLSRVLNPTQIALPADTFGEGDLDGLGHILDHCNNLLAPVLEHFDEQTRRTA